VIPLLLIIKPTWRWKKGRNYKGMFYFIIFLFSLSLTAFLTLLVKKAALYFRIVDEPDKNCVGGRKIHSKATPLMGGLAIFLAYFIILFLFHERFLSGDLHWGHLIGFFLGGLIVMVGGILDDKYNLSPLKQIIFPVLAIAAVIFGGVEIVKVTNPFGGYLDLESLFFISPLLIFLWLLGMMYTTKLLDGVDGLVSGVSAIGGFIIFLFTLATKYYQPDIAFAAILLAGACFGFLIFNWHPAKIFLGEGGSLLLGYILGVLAIISGGKIAIALLIMGIPILDLAWTIVRRLFRGKNPFKFADREHLHHNLLALGLGQRKTVLIFYLLSFIFGFSGLFLQSRGKLWALIILVFIMSALVVSFWWLNRRQKKNKPKLLLQICCAPCGTYISRERLLPKYNLTWYFYNPNLNTEEEYEKRLHYVKLAADKLKIDLVVEPYEHYSWLDKARCRAADPERGERCVICCRDRLEKTAQYARKNNFALFGTTLLVSPYKDGETIRAIGKELSGSDLVFLDDDFQSDDGYRHSQELAKELGFYRQKYCGCEYSLRK